VAGRGGAAGDRVSRRAPQISCVVPAYENVDLLARSLTSAMAQKDVEAEVIVSDDSRSGAVRDLVGALTMSVPGLRYVEGPRSGNPVDNWNSGLDHARAPLNLLLHHDEFLLDVFYFRRAAEAFDDAGVAAVMGRTRIVSSARPSRFPLVAGAARGLGYPPWLLPSLNWIGPTAAFAFRHGARFDPAYVFLVDVEFYRRILRAGRLEALRGVQVGSLGHHANQITARIDPPVLARLELDRMKATGAIGGGEHVFHRALLAARAEFG